MKNRETRKKPVSLKAKAQKPTQELSLHDWDFRNCHPDQIELCWGYEFSREAQWIIDQFEPMETRHLDHPEIIEWWYPLRLDKGEDIVSCQVWLPPGFPETPFLSLEEKLRIPPPPVMLSENFWAEFPEIDDRTAFLAENVKAKESNYCYPIYINWKKSNQAILRDLRHLVKRLRSEIVAKVETRGKSLRKVKEGELKALGAYRLLKSKSIAQAMEYTKKSANQPLYTDEANWSKAKKTAERVIRLFTRS